MRKGVYFDSVKLMLVTQKIKQMPGVIEAGVVMATDLNKDILARVNLLSDEGRNASTADLLIGIQALNQETIDAVTDQLDGLLNSSAPSGSVVEYKPKLLDGALIAQGDSNLAIVSVPGRFAKLEARKALGRGLHVLLFSDNVAMEDERELKQFAASRDLLLMGPDCGTAIINGVPLGFANKVRAGAIGIVGASGTGIQEVSTLIHKQGAGISHAIGTGGRDLAVGVGGITMLQGLKALNEDAATRVIVLISKPPAREIAEKIFAYISAAVTKPVVVNFLGGKPGEELVGKVEFANTLEDAALKAVQLERGGHVSMPMSDMEIDAIVTRESRHIGLGHIRGLFSGGTLNYEAILILEDIVGNIRSNTPVNKDLKLDDPFRLEGNACIDLGDDEFTVGRAHPMIDPTLRNRMLEEQIQADDVSIILLDVVLGYGAHDDPAAGIADILRRNAEKLSGKAVITSICGTDEDPQNYHQTKTALAGAGAIVVPSNRCAATIAGRLLNEQFRTEGARHVA